MEKKKAFSLRSVALIMATVLLASACSKTEHRVVQKDDTVTLRSVTMFGGSDANAAVYEQLWQGFVVEHPNIRIIDESRTSDEQWKAEVAADFCAGNEPDVLQKYHVDYPTDWESFQRAVRIFNQHGIVPVACSLSEVPHYWVEHFMLYCAGEESCMQIPEKVPQEWCRALSMFQEMHEMEAFPPNADIVSNDYVRSMFINKEAAMILEGNWFLASIEDQKNTIVIPFPQVENSAEAYGVAIGGMSSGFYITKRAFNNPQKRDAVVQYVMAQTNEKAVQKYWEHGGGTARAATPVNPLESQTTLTLSVNEFLTESQKQVLPLDARMDPAAYSTLISGIVEIYNGASPQDLWESVLAINARSED